jgi:hypothetical protein
MPKPSHALGRGRRRTPIFGPGIEQQKVSAILAVPLPAEWQQQAEQMRKNW